MQLTFHKDSQDALATCLHIANDTEVAQLDLAGVGSIALHFPKFSDGRAYSQAQQLRTRLKFAGSLLAHGDVLVDQLPHMQRLGFSQAVLRDDQSLEAATRALARFASYYQGDVVHQQPLFAGKATA